jgi:hypothetical protein
MSDIPQLGLTMTSLLIELEQESNLTLDVTDLITVTNGVDWIDFTIPVKDFGKNLNDRPVGLVEPIDISIVPKMEKEFKTLIELKSFFNDRTLTKTNLQELSKIDNLLYKMWYTYMIKTVEAYSILVLDNPLYLPRPNLESIFICRYGLFLSVEWQTFETFLEEVKELPNYDKWVEEQLLEFSGDQLTKEEIEFVESLDNYALTSKYYESYLVSKETALFLSLAEIEMYAGSMNVENISLGNDAFHIFKNMDKIKTKLLENNIEHQVVVQCGRILGKVLRYLPTYGKTTDELLNNRIGNME